MKEKKVMKFGRKHAGAIYRNRGRTRSDGSAPARHLTVSLACVDTGGCRAGVSRSNNVNYTH